MKRLADLFLRSQSRATTSSSSSANNHVVSKEEEQKCLMYGVSLAHLASLPIEHNKNFDSACTYVKKRTRKLQGYRSYAQFLKADHATEHLVRDQATVFVSYAWKGGFGNTMDALKEHFKDKLNETFVWMDFAVVDQHKAATTDIDFQEWATTFRESLVRIGQAVLVLTPGEEPIAISRSWCCFEWVTIVQANIPFSYCVPSNDEKELIKDMQDDIDFEDYNDIFAEINVEKAEAFKESDQNAILELMRQAGIVAVNDIVMKSLKNWLKNVAMKAVQLASDKTKKMTSALNAVASLHEALVSVSFGYTFEASETNQYLKIKSGRANSTKH